MEAPLSLIPGRPNRKLLQRVAEIDNLRRQGFTVADIHRTLTAQGMTIGYSSVRRECRKLSENERRINPTLSSLPPSSSTPPTPNAAPSTTAIAAGAKANNDSGKSKADVFFDSYVPSNPILDLLDRKRAPKKAS
jgi:hypothetical protein